MSALTSKSLTAGEKLVLMRRRNGKFGRVTSQRELARNIKVTRRQIQLAEDDETTPKDWPAPLKAFASGFDEAEVHELCFVARHRKKQSLDSLAVELGRSRFWVQQMELGRENPSELAAHWNL